DRAVELYDPAEHGRLAILFGQDIGAASLSWRAIAWWLLGYPENALADARRALELTRDARHAPTLIYVLNFSFWTHIRCGAYTAAAALVDEYVPLQSQMSSTFWGSVGADAARLSGGARRAIGGCRSIDHLRRRGDAIHRLHDVDAAVFVLPREGQRAHRSSERGLDQHRRSGESNRNDEGGVARRRTQSRRRRDCAHVAGAQGFGSFGRRRAWRGYSSLKAGGDRRAKFGRQSGSRKASIRSTCGRPSRCLTNWRRGAARNSRRISAEPPHCQTVTRSCNDSAFTSESAPLGIGAGGPRPWRLRLDPSDGGRAAVA